MGIPLAEGRTGHISLGTYGVFPFRRNLAVSAAQIATHIHVIGVSGSGKSRFLAHLYLSLLRAGFSATLIDPHGDLARLVLSHLVADGAFKDERGLDRIAYLDLPAAARVGKYLPFNVLAQPTAPHSIASNVMDALHRTWPALGDGAAPRFDKLVQNGLKVLIANHHPLPSLSRFLNDRAFRLQLLANETDPDVVWLWREWYDRLPERLQLEYIDSTLSRVNLLSFDPVLKFSLGQRSNALNFRSIIDTNKSTIINLAIQNVEAKRLLGCLLTVFAEHGAKSRSDLPVGTRLNTHFLIIDEFHSFSAQREDALTDLLSECRKYGLFLVLAHQTWSQASERLKGGLQNVGLEVAFRLGRSDAEHSATALAAPDPLRIKHEVADEGALERTHPVFYSLPEQWEGVTQQLQDLPQRHAVIGLHNLKRRWWWPFGYRPRRVVKVKTPSLPDPKHHRDELERIEAEYLKRYFRSQSEIEAERRSTLPTRQPVIPTRIEPVSTPSGSADAAQARTSVPASGTIFSTPTQATTKRVGKPRRTKIG